MAEHGPETPPRVGISSLAFELALGIIALLGVLPAIESYLETRLGRVIYVGLVFLALIGMLFARKREEARREWDQDQRDAKMERRHQETLSAIQRLEETRSAARVQVARSGPVGEPLLNALDWPTYATFVGTHGQPIRFTIRGKRKAKQIVIDSPQDNTALVLDKLREATRLLEEISKNPPKTPGAVQAATDKLNNLILRPEGLEVTAEIAGGRLERSE